MRGGPGRDRIKLGGGRDLVSAAGGDDVIHADDGTVDEIRCGPGADSADVDSEDRLRDCETVRRS